MKHISNHSVVPWSLNLKEKGRWIEKLKNRSHLKWNEIEFWPVLTAWNDRSKWSIKWPFAEMLKWLFAEMLIDCYLWGLLLKLHVLTIWRWFLIQCWWLMSFFKKTWSNEYDVRMLHLMLMSSDTLAKLSVDAKWLHPMLMHQMHWRSYLLMSDDCTRCWCIRCTDGWIKCQNCCTRSWNDSMHADDCLLMKLSELHLMLILSNVLTVV